MAKNPLDNGAAFDRSKWSLQEHCEYANAQLILNGRNEERRREGLPPIRWVIRGGQLRIENA